MSQKSYEAFRSFVDSTRKSIELLPPQKSGQPFTEPEIHLIILQLSVANAAIAIHGRLMGETVTPEQIGEAMDEIIKHVKGGGTPSDVEAVVNGTENLSVAETKNKPNQKETLPGPSWRFFHEHFSTLEVGISATPTESIHADRSHRA